MLVVIGGAELFTVCYTVRPKQTVTCWEYEKSLPKLPRNYAFIIRRGVVQ
jgi:hypothetical protein